VLVHGSQSFADTLVQVTLWSNNTQLPAQYSNVLYAYGYYSCYTLSIDLTVGGWAGAGWQGWVGWGQCVRVSQVAAAAAAADLGRLG
jgi:hypothetical protein